ncbi:winged helix-turn-helix domain-containing protein [Arhodomonas sp. SL1]|uniref:winged helix-turn-helix domain-containing protein n=1 Tax=Arhodomonas sp. SL1 TaxID=3425691 RepID=UPI003F88070C
MQVGELLADRSAADAVGREIELGRLRALYRGDGPRIAHIHGLPGIGKSTLLRCLLADARRRGLAIVPLDCRGIEPTPDCFLEALGEVAGLSPGAPERMAAGLSAAGVPVLLALDGFEVFRLLDAWLRMRFIPYLHDNARVVLAGRYPLAPGWLSGGWEELTLELSLGPLAPADAVALLGRDGVPPARCPDLAAGLHGHPLALRLAAHTLEGLRGPELGEAPLQQVMDMLTGIYLEEVREPVLRRVIDGAAVIRRVTVPLLAAMFPDVDAEAAYDGLRDLPFTETAGDGLRVHEAVRDALAQALRARDPPRYLEYRQRAWGALAEQAAGAGRRDLWRYTADMLYLIENPVCREAFFPSGATRLSVEHAQRDDHAAVRAIIRSQEGRDGAQSLERWLGRHPDAFMVVRGWQQACEGFCCRFVASEVDPAVLADDPVASAWQEHLRSNPIPAGATALFVRRWLDARQGERPGEVQAAAWLDLKRTYMEMRPGLRRVYLTLNDLVPYAGVAAQLGFRVLPEPAVNLDGRTYHTAVLDFGPDSVDGWLAGLAAGELGLERPPEIVDREGRELVVDGQRIPLTPLEFGLLAYLRDHAGRAVSRETLLREVWGSSYAGWSNKVDAVVAALRRKLGPWAGCIQTVTGVGYRYRDPGRSS